MYLWGNSCWVPLIICTMFYIGCTGKYNVYRGERCHDIGAEINILTVPFLTLFICKKLSTTQPCFHTLKWVHLSVCVAVAFMKRTFFILIQYCLLWLKRSTKLMWPRVYHSRVFLLSVDFDVGWSVSCFKRLFFG